MEYNDVYRECDKKEKAENDIFRKETVTLR